MKSSVQCYQYEVIVCLKYFNTNLFWPGGYVHVRINSYRHQQIMTIFCPVAYIITQLSLKNAQDCFICGYVILSKVFVGVLEYFCSLIWPLLFVDCCKQYFTQLFHSSIHPPTHPPTLPSSALVFQKQWYSFWKRS